MAAGRQFDMVEEKYIISSKKTLLDALTQISNIKKGPLVLFVVDEENRMVGTLTDGDSRRALISGASLSDKTEEIMHCEFNFMRDDDLQNVQEIRRQRDMLMKLVPILDSERHIVDIINLQKFITRLPIDAVLMAGGKGERLRPLTEKTPKPLIKVGDKCIIDYNIDHLIEYGVENISVTVNYLKEQLEEHFKEPRNGVQVNTVREPKYLGTIGSILFVEEFKNDTILVMNSDLFTNINFEDFYLHFKEYDAMMSVASIPYNVSIPLGILDLDGRNIKGLIEKPKYNYYANGGIYLIKKEALQYIPKDTFFNATDLIGALIEQNKKVIRYPLNGTWIDIGQHADLAKAQDLVKHLR